MPDLKIGPTYAGDRHLPTTSTLNESGRKVARPPARRRSVLRGRQVDPVRLLVERDRARAALGGDVLEDLPLATVLLNDRQRAVAVRAERVAGCPDRTPRRRNLHRSAVSPGPCRHRDPTRPSGGSRRRRRGGGTLASNASPDGSVHGLIEYFRVIVAFAVSISAISPVSSMLT